MGHHQIRNKVVVEVEEGDAFEPLLECCILKEMTYFAANFLETNLGIQISSICWVQQNGFTYSYLTMKQHEFMKYFFFCNENKPMRNV
jgi:hypothetical protein